MALRLRGATSGYIELKAPASAGDNTLTLPTNNGSANQLLKTDGSGNLSWTDDNSGVSLSGSTNNTIATVTGANALIGEANLTFNGSGDLTVKGNDGISANLYLISHAGDTDGDGWRVGSNQDVKDLTIANNTTGSYVDKITVLKTGEVGIGTSTPNNKLDVNGGIVCSPNTDGKDTFELSTHAANEGRLSIKNVDTKTVQIRAGGDTYFNGGNVGIGTTSPESKLHISASMDGLFVGDITAPTSGDEYANLMVKNSQADGYSASFTAYNASGKGLKIYNNGGSAARHALLVSQAGGVRFSVDGNGDVNVNTGNLVIGTAGKGIDFSAQTGTAATGAATGAAPAEVLDHYEEGTFTAKAYESGNAITLSYNNTHGKYTRVGNMVTLWMWIRAAGTTTSTGGLQIGGLPFASNVNSYRPAIVGRAYNLANFTGKSGVCFWMGGSSSTITVVAIDGNGLVEGSNVSNNVWQSGAELHCTFSYFV